MVEQLKGGAADGRPARTFDKADLAKGRAVEREHTADPRAAAEIAKDHLAEFPDYYAELARMEAKLERRELNKRAYLLGYLRRDR
jgi:hypothetical protein